ncbi:MAG: hypothetical protein ACYTGV_13560 [Planctomycetota bacterium]|jgi:hypothetical protein
MSYYKKSSPVPWIAAVVLVVAFIGIVVWTTREKKPELPPAPVAFEEPEPEPVPVPVRYEPVEEPPPPKPQLSAAQAEKLLQRATKEWRAFAVQLCKRKKWSSQRAADFLKNVTWSDRDRAKQHAQDLASIGKMLGVQTQDPVALAEALDSKGRLDKFFEENWSKVEVEWKAEPARDETVLDDAWKPNRIRWGFPLDTPIAQLQEFKQVGLRAAQQTWHGLAGTYIQGLEVDNDAKGTMFAGAIGQGLRTQEAKMHAGLKVLLNMPEGSVKDVAEEVARQLAAEGREEFVKSLASKMDAAIEAAQAVE